MSAAQKRYCIVAVRLRRRVVPAAYCREKKIYIFADTFEKSGNADYVLYHENIHAMIDSLSGYPKDKLRSIAKILVSSDVRLAKLYEALGEGYNLADVDEEFTADVLAGRLLNSRKFEKLYNILGESERDVDRIVKHIDNVNEYRNIEAVRGVLPGRSKGDASSAGTDRFRYRIDEEPIIDGFARSTVEAGADLGGSGGAGRDSGADLARKGDSYVAYSAAGV